MRVHHFFVLIAGALVLTGCGSTTDNSNEENYSSGLNLQAQVDPRTSTVTLPSRRFYITEWEESRLMDAVSVAGALCAREKLGIEKYASPGWEEVPAEHLMFSELGPWTPDMANRFAFVLPMTRGELSANGLGPKPKNDAELEAAYSAYELSHAEHEQATAACGEGTGNEMLDKFGDALMNAWDGPWVAEFTAVEEQLFTDPRLEGVVTELVNCYNEAGLSAEINPDAEVERDGLWPITIAGLDALTIDEQQISMANTVVACKEQTDAIKRVIDVWAAKEAPIVEKYAAELTDMRTQLEKLTAEAVEYVNQHRDIQRPIFEMEW